MTVTNELCRASFPWTGSAAPLPLGFSALAAAHLTVTHTSLAGVPTVLAPGVNFTVSLAPVTNLATVTPILPWPSNDGTVEILRRTPALQETDFRNSDAFDADVHETLADRAARRDAELRDAVTRAAAMDAAVVAQIAAATAAIAAANAELDAIDAIILALATPGTALSIATQPEAEAGADNTKALTPLRGLQLLDRNGVRINGAEALLASAATVDMATAANLRVRITGSVTISSFGTGQNLIRLVTANAAVTLVHSANLACPAGVNLALAAGDTFLAVSNAAGQWRIALFQRADGSPFTFAPFDTRYAALVHTHPRIITRTITSLSSAADRTLTAADFGRVILLAGTVDFTVTIDPAAGLGNGWTCNLKHTSRCLVTINPDAAETIDGAATLAIGFKQECALICSGSAFEAFGLKDVALLEGATLASAVNFIDVALPRGYASFRLDMDGFEPTATSGLFVRLSNDGGVSYFSSNGAYVWHQTYGSVGSVAGYSPAVGGVTNVIELSSGAMSAASGVRSRIAMDIVPRSVSRFGGISWQGAIGAYVNNGVGYVGNSSADLTHIRILTNNQIATGARYFLYGVRA
jgi:hypothetical protein